MAHTQRRFNLVEEAWIPVADHGRVSLRDIFSNPDLRALGGNPIQKIAVTKLLLAIAQAAHTPKDMEEWKTLGADGLARKSLDYLDTKKDCFWLYGDRPFLQMPEILPKVEQLRNAATLKDREHFEPRQFSSGDFPDLLAVNNTLVKQQDFYQMTTDAEKALFILTLMSFALAGKQHNHRIILDINLSKKGEVAKPGPSLGRLCFLHSYILGTSIIETVYLNMFTTEQIADLKYYTEQLGTPVWEKMPQHENCPIAEKLLHSYQGMLVPLSRFVLLQENLLYYTEGVIYPNHQEGWLEPTMAFKLQNEKVIVLVTKIERKPWRDITALLAFVGQQQGDYECQQLRHGVHKAKTAGLEVLSIWSGGITASSDSFGQKVSGFSDFVESSFSIRTEILDATWFHMLKCEMQRLDGLDSKVGSSAENYYKRISGRKENNKSAQDNRKQAVALFWDLAEQSFQCLVDACDEPSGEQVEAMRRLFIGYANRAYDAYAPRDSARQLEAWASNRPKLGKLYPPKQKEQETT